MNREELREAIVNVVADNIRGYHHHIGDNAPGVRSRAREANAGPVADALLDGPVGDLLAEAERLRAILDGADTERPEPTGSEGE